MSLKWESHVSKSKKFRIRDATKFAYNALAIYNNAPVIISPIANLVQAFFPSFTHNLSF